MASPEFRQVLRFFAITGMVGMFLLISVHLVGGQAYAKPLSQPRYQEGYPPTEDVPTYAYPGDENPTEGPTSGYPGEASPTTGAGTATRPAATSGPTRTPANTLTATATSPDYFLTENAEMGGSSITPPASLTPLGTGTPASTETLTPTRTPLSTLIPPGQDNGSHLDWGLFWIGFSVPIIAACGVVLYLLDHRPELFSIKRK